jgi:hypothetical protein
METKRLYSVQGVYWQNFNDAVLTWAFWSEAVQFKFEPYKEYKTHKFGNKG